jgi:hypothetical protein
MRSAKSSRPDKKRHGRGTLLVEIKKNSLLNLAQV